MKTSQFYVKNQFILEDNENVYLQSYDSIIAKWNGETIALSDHWDYSTTTSKYLYKFIDNYCLGVSRLMPATGKRAYMNRLIKDGIVTVSISHRDGSTI